MILSIEHGQVQELQLNRPPVNALNGELIVALKETILSATSAGARALILSGTAGRYSGGLDVPILLRMDRAAMAQLWRDFYALLGTIAKSPIPIVAAITGHAPAGGTVLALFCDWRIMAQGDYKIGLNEVQVGIPLPPVLVAGLRRLIGPRQAECLAVSGLLMSPSEALGVRLVDELAPPEQVVNRAREWCERLLALPSEAMTVTRKEVRSDLTALFDVDLEPELQRVIAAWWHPSTQNTLHALVERLKKKAS